MSEFDFWQRWGLELSDQQFADAFAALGLLATRFSSSRAGLERAASSRSLLKGEKSLTEQELQELLHPIVERARMKAQPAEWRFPEADRRLRIGSSYVRLSNLDPLQVAATWTRVIRSFPSPPRLRVTRYPTGDPVGHWFRLLFEATPPGKAVHIHFDAPLPPRHWKWPLRFGYLPGNGAEESVHRALSMWPANQLARAIGIDRDNADCDVLVFDGGSRQLLRALLDLPGPQKCIGVIVRGRMEDDLTPVHHRLAAIAAESCANGFVFLHPDVPDDVWAQALNRFVESLSHNQPVDMSVSEAFAHEFQTDPVVFLSREICGFRISRLLETIHSRLKELPREARLPLEPDTLPRMNMPVEHVADRPNAAAVLKTFARHKRNISFDAESTGALGMAEMSAAIERAEVPKKTKEERARRFLQQQSLIKVGGRYRDEKRAFVQGVPTLIRVRIGPADEKWMSMAEEFPEQKLPKEMQSWRLTVVLTEPDHLKQPQRKFIRLKKDGPSTPCEFRFVPGQHALFEGRITVLHRGRVLQTAVIKAAVVSDEREIPAEAAIELVESIQVRADIGDLDERRQFDLAFVVNHTTDDRPRLQAIAANHAWIADISDCKAISSEINDALSKVAKSVNDYSGGLDSDNNRTLLVKLAQYGRQLHGYLVEDQIMARTNRAEIADKEYIQIVSTRSDAVVPFEFIYEHETPDDDAEICSNWRIGLTEGKCRESCDTTTGKKVCPLGFWGVSKVIERHIYTPELAQEGKEMFLQSECTSDRAELALNGAAVVAASKRVDDESLAPVLAALESRLGAPPQRANDWEQWAELVKSFNPNLLIALPHTDGNGTDATLEIGGKTIKSIQIKEAHVRPQESGGYPIAALLGCDTTGTAMEYGSHVAVFRRKGAAIVIGTIATVFGKHAARVAEQMVNGLKQEQNGKKPERLGEVMRSIKRKALLDGLLMALCVVAFGDADWKLNGKES